MAVRKEDPAETASRGAKLADLCRQLVSDTYEPAVVLVTRELECVHSAGPIHRYFHTQPAGPSSDLIALAHPGIESPLRQAVRQAIDEDRRVVAAELPLPQSSQKFTIDVQPIFHDGERLLLVCLTDDHHLGAPKTGSSPRVVASDGARSHYADHLPVPEGPMLIEDELHSLSGALDALNIQLRAARDREQITVEDLHNLFQYANMEVIFLDTQLNIRFFTPAMKAQLGVTLEDVGRPFSDLGAVRSDADLMSDVQTVLQQHVPTEREIEGADRRWFKRRCFPYRAHAGVKEGVVIAFIDVTELKLSADSVAEAKGQAQSANEMRSRSLAAVSYYLREPLNSLVLLQGLLERKFEGDAAQRMAALLDQALSTMSGMLNTLVDVDQLDSGTVHVEARQFPINELLGHLGEDFSSHAKVQGLDFRVVPCSLFVRSDRRLLEQAMRTLLLNALKNTPRGKILLGCRRRGAMLSIEILDTGLGIPEAQLRLPPAEVNTFSSILGEQSRGIGLTLAKRVCSILGHQLTVNSSLGRGSFFAVEVPLLANNTLGAINPWKQSLSTTVGDARQRTGTILVIEDDPKMYELLELLLKEEGHTVVTARDEIAVLEMVARGSIRPDLTVADYRLLHIADKVHATTKLEEEFLKRVPIIVLLDDVSREGVNELAFQNCVPLNKPIRAAELTQVIQQLLALQQSAPEPGSDDVAKRREFTAEPLKLLTERQRQIMELVLAGYPSKNIAADLGISRRTVENHRASIMRKTGAKSIPELARMALAGRDRN